MVFTKRLRDGVRQGKITLSVRFWKHPHVRPGGLYPMEEGLIEVQSVEPIAAEAITADLARESGFPSLDALLEVAHHGSSKTAFLVQFRYLAPGEKRN
jgi:hypothetical protein